MIYLTTHRAHSRKENRNGINGYLYERERSRSASTALHGVALPLDPVLARAQAASLGADWVDLKSLAPRRGTPHG